MLILWSSAAVKGQQNQPFPPVEKLQLFTDRSLYISGETVQFSVCFLNPDSNQPEISHILYAEIISPDARQLIGGKFTLQDQSSHGSLSIPKYMSSGFYYLRVYTKYMRNLGPSSYSYRCILIINPLRKDVLAGNDSMDIWNKLQPSDHQASFLFKMDQDQFLPRQKVRVQIEAVDQASANMKGLCISVVPEMAASEYPIHLQPEAKSFRQMDFYPETRGLSISGALQDKNSGKILVDKRVNLSIIGEDHDFMVIRTDSQGRYYFSLPAYSGNRDLILTAEKSSNRQANILIDNDFCTIPIQLPSPSLQLGVKERLRVHKMAVNAQIRELFQVDSLADKMTNTASKRAFYGFPSDVIHIDQYIELPSLEEYFNELPTLVKVRKKQGKKYFKLLGSMAEMSIYDPLVMVDWVAIEDADRVLALSPRTIDRIEVVNAPYIKGNITYGGIVSIISKQADFGGIEFPESGIFVNYLFLHEYERPDVPSVLSENTPDARNTLYWEARPVLDANKQLEFNFMTPDTPGLYQIVIKGINRTAGVITDTFFFEVIDNL
ncbi:MAG: hypothetical protein ISR55_13035 [Bacteroidetes bacterium]|nr:hypothetical protein [Bacteroidota bacterium]